MILPSYILIVLHECQACFLIIKKLLKFKSHHSLILKLILSHHQLPLQLLEILGAMLLRWEVKNEARAFRRGGGTSPGASKNETYLLAVVRNAKKKKQNSFGTAGCRLKQIGEATVLFCNLKARFWKKK